MVRVSTVDKLDVTQYKLNLLNNKKKLNELGESETNKRVSELTEINKYTNNTTDEISATKDNAIGLTNNSAKEYTLAAHDYGLDKETKKKLRKSKFYV